MKEAARTSVLSSRWINLIYFVDLLGFIKLSKCNKTKSNGELEGISLVNHVPKCLKSSVASTLGKDDNLRSHLLIETSDCETSSEKLPPRESVPKYLKLIRHVLYSKVWKRQNEKVKSTASLTTPSTAPANARVQLSSRSSLEGGRTGGALRGALRF
ncbi:hypothetical protein ABFS82_12G115000 [Erythranthe guttata]|uniref:Uncharacterized protein n=1 Tax=Erythranthe guttata TaxID=4155 RepID=A0A022QP36_ERYGU|nr:hypothetical protein MIMGU_mgv1a015481mg [Erythranthe guttata]